MPLILIKEILRQSSIESCNSKTGVAMVTESMCTSSHVFFFFFFFFSGKGVERENVERDRQIEAGWIHTKNYFLCLCV